ncbi:2-phosphoxylose phosphatase 1 [Entomophthora muscae]|uniref:2-phosphoxylose phosphatase 1 n=1 Tax=Entomophthora muscae TaxID=34485 RepID=A0ACC2SL06_9FUNG|nr:2-phosphoxylose phosphatase 1 [Entomophthora muscae]
MMQLITTLFFGRLVAGSLAYCNAGYPDKANYRALDGYTLLSVHLLARHGDRAPLSNLPSGMFDMQWKCAQAEVKDTSIKVHGIDPKETCALGQKCKPTNGTEGVSGTCGLEHLTTHGISQHRKLGAGLRSVYKKLIPSLYVRSTDTQRTYWSSVALLSGLQDSTAPTASIDMLPTSDDDLIPIETNCKKGKAILKALRNTSALKEPIAYIKKTLKDHNYILPSKPSVEYNAADSIRAHVCHGATPKPKDNKPLDPPTVDSFFTAMDKVIHALYFNSPSTANHRIFMGPYLLNMKKDILNSISLDSSTTLIQSPKKPKALSIFSAHDITIYSLLSALNINDSM